MIGNCQLRSTTTRQRNKRAARTRERVKGKAHGKSDPKGWVAPFPQSANPDHRYSPDTPWLAIVNARGPKGVWKQERKDPSWIPLCLDLFTHPAWSTWTLECQMFTQILWRYAAKEDVNGIIWGEVETLRRQMRQVDGFQTCATIRALCEDRQKFAGFLELHAQAGLIVYLSDAEKEAAERLIFAKHKGQDRDRDRDNTETADSPDSGSVVYESTIPDSPQTTGENRENTAQQSQSHSTAQATGTSQGDSPVQDRQPANPQKPEAAGLASRRGPEGPRIDTPRRPAHSLNPRHTDFQSNGPCASTASTMGYNAILRQKRGLQVIYKWTSK